MGKTRKYDRYQDDDGELKRNKQAIKRDMMRRKEKQIRRALRLRSIDDLSEEQDMR